MEFLEKLLKNIEENNLNTEPKHLKIVERTTLGLQK